MQFIIVSWEILADWNYFWSDISFETICCLHNRNKFMEFVSYKIREKMRISRFSTDRYFHWIRGFSLCFGFLVSLVSSSSYVSYFRCCLLGVISSEDQLLCKNISKSSPPLSKHFVLSACTTNTQSMRFSYVYFIEADLRTWNYTNFV